MFYDWVILVWIDQTAVWYWVKPHIDINVGEIRKIPNALKNNNPLSAHQLLYLLRLWFHLEIVWAQDIRPSFHQSSGSMSQRGPELHLPHYLIWLPWEDSLTSTEEYKITSMPQGLFLAWHGQNISPERLPGSIYLRYPMGCRSCSFTLAPRQMTELLSEGRN